ncbi:MAG: hypothetical protein ACLSIL_10930 [Enterococcus casseliflavus]
MELSEISVEKNQKGNERSAQQRAKPDVYVSSTIPFSVLITLICAYPFYYSDH